MGVAPGSPLAPPEGRAEKVSQRSRLALSITGWLVLLAAIHLALRPTAFSASRKVNNVPSPSAVRRKRRSDN